MGMSVQFELSDKDLSYFYDVLHKARSTAALGSEASIIDKATCLLNEVENTEKFPPFIALGFQHLHILMEMLSDSDWNIPGEQKTEVLNVLAYFVDGYDLIPDDIPGIGYLDDVIMIELVVKELAKEFKNYSEFQHYREQESKIHHKEHVSRDEWEDHNRVAMYQRMRSRHTNGSVF